MVVLAHPDDESLACGGTIARCADAGAEVTLVCATRGEAGSFDAALEIPAGQLAKVRTAELEAACAVLGIAHLEWLDLEDGMLPWLPAAEVSDAIGRVAEAVRPEAIITFGRDGLYWHPDHIAIGERTREAARATAACAGAALYCVTLPPRAMPQVASAARLASGRTDVSFWGVPASIFGRGAPSPTLVVDVSSVLTRKLAAMQCHRSQLAPLNPLRDLTPDHPHFALAFENFHLADTSPAPSSFLDRLRGVTVADIVV